jgi:hypothetical protein
MMRQNNVEVSQSVANEISASFRMRKLYNQLLYWQLQSQQYPTLSKFAIDILTIPASAADCERTFSEFGDMLGMWRLRMKVELITALQCLKSWRQIGLKTPKPGHTADELAAVQAYLGNFESFS